MKPIKEREDDITKERNYWAKGRRLGYFDDFKFPKWLKGD